MNRTRTTFPYKEFSAASVIIVVDIHERFTKTTRVFTGFSREMCIV